MKSIYDLIITKKSKTERLDYKILESQIIKIRSDNPSEKIALVICKAKNALPGNPITLMCHGEDEIMENIIFTVNFLEPFGMNICLMDYRGYGHSDGQIRTSGFNEYLDVVTVMKYLKKKGYNKISLLGYSIGASIGILLTKEFPDLVFLAIDSPYMSFKEFIKNKAKSLNISDKTFDIALPRVYSKIKNDIGIDYNCFQDPRGVISQITQPIILAQL